MSFLDFKDLPDAHYLHDLGDLFITARTPGDVPGSAETVHILGMPVDTGVSFRRGARFGPRFVRYFSHSLESFSPALGRDLEALRIIDHGDAVLEGHIDEALTKEVELAVSAISTDRVCLIGGDHSASIGAINAYYRRHPDLYVIHIDAHLDQREEYDGTRFSHACPMRRISEMLGDDRLVQLGIRSGSQEEWAEARRSDLYLSSELALPDQVRATLSDAPIYVSLDIDVLDPSVAPGVGDPEPGGASYHQLEALVHAFQGLNIVACDLMETDPLFDPSGITSAAAAKITREMILTFWGK